MLCRRLLFLVNDFSRDTISFFLSACPSVRIVPRGILEDLVLGETWIPPGERDKRSLTLTCEYSLVGALARVHLSPRVRPCSFTGSFSTASGRLGPSRRRDCGARSSTHLAAVSRSDDDDDDDDDGNGTPHCSRLTRGCGHDRQQKRTRDASSFAAGTKTRANLGCPPGGCGSGVWSRTVCVCSPHRTALHRTAPHCTAPHRTV